MNIDWYECWMAFFKVGVTWAGVILILFAIGFGMVLGVSAIITKIKEKKNENGERSTSRD